MAGIYLHIPFCRQACNYCNFHFSTSLKHKTAFVQSLLKEIVLQKNYLTGPDGAIPAVKSIYFGGGTPSLLDKEELHIIFESLYKNFNIMPDAEITLEANPDDISEKTLMALKATPVNRLSIGIQSFQNADLQFMNRAHSAEEGIKSIELAMDLGFNNLTVDLIYGTPTLSDASWLHNLEKVFSYGIPHLSCYCLTVEDKTPLAYMVEKGRAPAVDEDRAAAQFEILLKQIRAEGYEQYEISNFCKDGQYAVHNSNYWRKEKYLGLGPSAHSYDGYSRQWNVSANLQYIQSVNNDIIPFEKEILTEAQRYNEYILTTLRTVWGCDLVTIRDLFGEAVFDHLHHEIKIFSEQGLLKLSNNTIYLTDSGKLLADKITAALFL